MIYEALRRFAFPAALFVAFALVLPSQAQQASQGSKTAAPKAQPAPSKDPYATEVRVSEAQPAMAPQAPMAAPQPAAAPQAPAAAQADSSKSESELDALKSKVASEEKALAELDSQIVSRTARIQEMLDSYNKAEKNLTGFNGLGRVEQMELKAELYAGERLARKRIGDEFASLSKTVGQWESLKRKIKEDQGLLALKKQIADLKSGASAEANGGSQSSASSPKSIAEIEYYQVKKDADLRTISAYPDVYGSSDLWEHLFKANKSKLQDPNKIVPAGTTLIVPQDAKKLPDFSDL